MAGFIFGGNTPWTYDELQRKRAVAESLLAGAGSAPRNVGEGLNAIGKALAYRGIEKRATKEEARMRDEFNAKWDGAFGSGIPGMGGPSGGGTPSGTWTPEPPKPNALEVAQGTMEGGMSFPGLPKAELGGGADLSYGSAVMTPQEMLIEGAKVRGWDPIDVATAISYETGGTFDPMISGPTTQWGTHRGPIQFGEPQAAKYGIDFSSPDAAWRSSLDPTSGGVWKYLEDAGVKPGMGLDQIYSAINAGGVNRFGASDANNGGAPGTVADKVAGMGDHRVKAAEFLGGTWTPNGGGQPVSASSSGTMPQMDMATLAALAGDPMASPQQKAIVEALIGQQMAAMDPMRQMELEMAQLELAQMKNPTVDPMAEIELAQAQLDYEQDKNPVVKPGYVKLTPEEVKAEGLPDGQYQRSPEGKIEVIGGGGVTNNFDIGGSGKQIYDTIAASADKANTAAIGLGSLSEAKAALEGGAITGFAADQRLYLQKLGSYLGISDPSAIENTETFRAAIAPQVSAMIKATVGSANISNADREFAEKAAAGTITLDEASIKRMVGVMEKMGRDAIDAHNKKVNSVYPEGKGFDQERALFLIPDPADAPPNAPTGNTTASGVTWSVEP